VAGLPNVSQSGTAWLSVPCLRACAASAPAIRSQSLWIDGGAGWEVPECFPGGSRASGVAATCQGPYLCRVAESRGG
jgi:hypothetical protein